MRQHISRAIHIGAATFALTTIIGSASAAVVLNSSFEALTGSDPSHFSGGLLIDGHTSTSANPLSSPQTYVTADPTPSWTVDTLSGGTMNPTQSIMPPGPIEGQNVAYSTGAILSQEMTWDIQPSTRYMLTVSVGHTTIAGAFAYHTWLSSSGFVLADDANTVTISPGTWGLSTITWDSPGDVPEGSKLTINLASNGGVVLFDDVQFFGASLAPEPASTTLLAVPALAAMKRRRRSGVAR